MMCLPSAAEFVSRKKRKTWNSALINEQSLAFAHRIRGYDGDTPVFAECISAQPTLSQPNIKPYRKRSHCFMKLVRRFVDRIIDAQFRQTDDVIIFICGVPFGRIEVWKRPNVPIFRPFLFGKLFQWLSVNTIGRLLWMRWDLFSWLLTIFHFFSIGEPVWCRVKKPRASGFMCNPFKLWPPVHVELIRGNPLELAHVIL